MTDHALHLTGSDHLSYGELTVVEAGPLVAAMSVGADQFSPSMQFKGNVPNEDALSARTDGPRARLIVADSHFGNEASDLLVRAVHGAPYDIAEAPLIVSRSANDGSETTFTSVWLDRDAGRVQVHAFGDSLALRLRRDGGATVMVDADSRFVTPEAFAWADAQQDSFAVEAGDVLLAFTDGVNECHYRNPGTSITLDHIRAMFHEHPGDLRAFVEQLGEQALRGVDGNPGGQDNIAIVAITV